MGDRTLSLVKVKCVLKKRTKPRPSRSITYYGTKQHCAPMIFFFSLLPGQNLSEKAKQLDPKASGVTDYDYRADLYG